MSNRQCLPGGGDRLPGPGRRPSYPPGGYRRQHVQLVLVGYVVVVFSSYFTFASGGLRPGGRVPLPLASGGRGRSPFGLALLSCCRCPSSSPRPSPPADERPAPSTYTSRSRPGPPGPSSSSTTIASGRRSRSCSALALLSSPCRSSGPFKAPLVPAPAGNYSYLFSRASAEHELPSPPEARRVAVFETRCSPARCLLLLPLLHHVAVFCSCHRRHHADDLLLFVSAKHELRWSRDSRDAAPVKRGVFRDAPQSYITVSASRRRAPSVLNVLHE